MERIALSKKTRFEVFKRDGFRCVYCGATPSETVLLEADHIHPVAAGGTNDIDNLVTACDACNRGKGARLLTSVPPTLEEKALEVAEREAQIRAYYEILDAKKQRKDDELWSIADIYMERFGDDNILRTRLASIGTFLDRLDYHEVVEAMEIATRKMSSRVPAFNYFCGICWRKIKRANGEDV
ncbi:HNH endonuclease [Bradyrhizobium sp. NFR13]|uniref:HNH endonuclease n=1 Tax=Bradyrhizobium sp. NFR13 TaxID=1566285 RepID=UPI0008DEAEE7|nr:HNH endonuclease [Bradyrhizobium sp. NFR13]SFM00232.1 HNH endonuclease [Bradyrhizobium sp. NFR13]